MSEKKGRIGRRMDGEVREGRMRKRVRDVREEKKDGEVGRGSGQEKE